MGFCYVYVHLFLHRQTLRQFVWNSKYEIVVPTIYAFWNWEWITRYNWVIESYHRFIKWIIHEDHFDKSMCKNMIDWRQVSHCQVLYVERRKQVPQSRDASILFSWQILVFVIHTCIEITVEITWFVFYIEFEME